MQLLQSQPKLMDAFCRSTVCPLCRADKTISVESPQFWYDAYRVRLKRDSSPACPSFLGGLIPGILSAGKSVVLMRTHQKPDLK